MAQRDLHFYATLALAKTAGYSNDDAKLLAWANLETDRTLQVKWHNCAWSNKGLYFHFWPGDPKDLICRVDSVLSRQIMDDLSSLRPGFRGDITKCRLGIALHGLQDTYSHQNWVGKFSRHNVLPAWSHGKFTPSLPFYHGHSPKPEADFANVTWYDPRTGETINNISRVCDALNASAQVLGIAECPQNVADIFIEEDDYEARKQALRELAGMPALRFSEIRKAMLAKYKEPFMQAAAAQAKIVKGYLNG
jgi:hypothetical protein